MSADRPEASRRGLGRGLAALLGEEKAAVESAGARPRHPQALAVAHIHPGRFQPRRHFDEDELKALAASIREQGVLQPILVRPLADRPGEFELIAGERRWRAAQLAGIHEIPALVRELGDREVLEIALVENVQRQDLQPLEEAEGYRRLMDEFGHTQEALSEVVGKSRSHIANLLRLLGLADGIKAMIRDGKISAGHARALMKAEDPLAVAREVVARGLSVRQTEELVYGPRPGRRKKAKRGSGLPGARPKSADVRALERELADRLGMKVVLNEDGDERGVIAIRYTTLEQLDDLLRRLRG